MSNKELVERVEAYENIKEIYKEEGRQEYDYMSSTDAFTSNTNTNFNATNTNTCFKSSPITSLNDLRHLTDIQFDNDGNRTGDQEASSILK